MNPSYIWNVFAPFDIEFDYGDGVYLYSQNNKKYLDFGSGIAVNSLGHNHTGYIEEMIKQSSRVNHHSNWYKNLGMQKTGKLLSELIYGKDIIGQSFFSNSGAEAVEAAIKLTRAYFQKTDPNSRKQKILTFSNCFHGRTIATCSAAGAEKLTQYYLPNLNGFIHAEFNNLDSVKKTLNQENVDSVAGILIEPIQGEGGILPANQEFMDGMNDLCKKHNILLISDEVQAGAFRTGKFLSIQNYGIIPDIVTLAKGIGNGYPVGACVARKEIANVMEVGMHGSTYGGNPVATSLIYYVLDQLHNMSGHIQEIGEYLYSNTEYHLSSAKSVSKIRGKGMMIGIELNEEYINMEIVKELQSKGLLTIPASNNTIRLLPPMTIHKQHVEEALEILNSVL